MDGATQKLIQLLAPLTNYERQRADAPRWSLDNMRALLRSRTFALPRGRLIQVGGSKGKGTTALYLESMAAAMGLQTGCYLSPHLESMLERVRVGGRHATEEELLAALRPILAFADRRAVEPSFFEVLTAAALSRFAAHDIDLGVLEVGLGGRLDATTAVPVDASVLTTVELEHTDVLGDDLRSIAAEKAWIVRPGRPAFTAASGEALAVVEQRSAEVGAELQVLGRDFRIAELTDRGSAFAGVLDLAGGARRFTLPAAAAFELPAMALATACLQALWPDRPLPLEPVPRPRLPGRFEWWTAADGWPVVLDGAHTEASWRVVAGEFERRCPGRRLALLFASSADKRWQECLKCLLPRVDKCHVTALTGVRSANPREIADWLLRQGVRADVVDTVPEGLECLLTHAGPRLIAGSFYLVGAARSELAAHRILSSQ